MRAIDADRLLDRCKFYHLPNGDIAVPIIDVQHAPTIEIEPHWIPVEQELPEYGKAVLTITQDETYEVNHVIDEECGEWFWEDNGKVIAWMPLPEPFKGVME